MATMNRVVEYVNRVKPNSFSREELYRWIAALEGRVAREIVCDGEKECAVPDDADTELLVPAPYDGVYALYVMAQIDFFSREYDSYNNAVLAFSELMAAFRHWYLQHNAPRGAKNFRNVMW